MGRSNEPRPAWSSDLRGLATTGARRPDYWSLRSIVGGSGTKGALCLNRANEHEGLRRQARDEPAPRAHRALDQAPPRLSIWDVAFGNEDARDLSPTLCDAKEPPGPAHWHPSWDCTVGFTPRRSGAAKGLIAEPPPQAGGGIHWSPAPAASVGPAPPDALRFTGVRAAVNKEDANE